MPPTLGEGKNALLFSLALAVVFAAASLILKKGNWAIGVLLGVLIGMLNFYLLFQHLARIQNPISNAGSPKNPFLSAWAPAGLFFARYLFLAAIFFLIFKTHWIHFIGFILGFFLVHVNLGAASVIKLIRQAK